MLPEKVRAYMLHGLAATPVVIADILKDITEADYDLKPDPERFSLREVLGHLADWEGVWLERARKIATEETPALPGYDEGVWAIEHDYAHADAREQLARFVAGRAAFLAYLHSLPTEAWDRRAVHAEWGHIRLEEMATLVLGHDGYHTRQLVEWLNSK